MPTHTENLGSAPVVIGVTGHRDLRDEDRPALLERATAVLQRINDVTGDTPIYLMSALAEGADQLVAQAALRQGIRLVVPLPMPRDLYVAQFDDDAARKTFNELAQQAYRVYEIALPKGVGVEQLRDSSLLRQHQYALLGDEISRCCHVLLALWDGSAGKTGGTEEVIAAMRRGTGVAQSSSLENVSLHAGAPVYQIVTPRRSNSNPRSEPLAIHVLPPTARGADSSPEILPPAVNLAANDWHDQCVLDAVSQITVFNARLTHLVQHDTLDVLGSIRDLNVLDQTGLNQLCEKVKHGPMPPAQLRESLESLVTKVPSRSSPEAMATKLFRYGGCDMLARRCQKQTRRWAIIRVLCVMVGIMIFEMTTGPVATTVWSLLTYMAFIAIGIAVLGRPWQRTEVGFLEHRLLAEYLRVDFFLHLVQPHRLRLDRFMRFQSPELDWLGRLIVGWEITATDKPAATGADDQKAIELVQQEWIRSQHKYFGKSMVREARKERNFNLLFRALTMTAVVLTTVVIIGAIHQHARDDLTLRIDSDFAAWCLFIIIAMMIAAASTRGYASYRAFAEHINRYEMMWRRFDAGDRIVTQLVTAGEHARAIHTLQALAEQALQENYDWFVLHRERPIEMNAM